MGKHEPIPSRERVARRRAALRAQGLAPRQFWLPDLRRPDLASQAAMQSARVAISDHAAADQAFVDAVTDWDSLI